MTFKKRDRQIGIRMVDLGQKIARLTVLRTVAMPSILK